jgi:SAM-dependent methyltransferase
MENVDLQSEVERLYHQANLNVPKESRCLRQFGLQDGMAVLEVASGPGFVTEWLSQLVPNGSITCLEIDPLLIEHAERYLPDKASCGYRLVKGNALNTEFDDDSFDFVFVRLLYEHLEDPVVAAREAFRVIKPGGKLVVTEGDSAFNILTDPYYPEVEPIRQKLLGIQRGQGGQPMIGRALWKTLKAAGFQNIDIEAVVSHSGDKGLDFYYPHLNPQRMVPLVEAGLLTAEEEGVLRDVVTRFLESDDGFYMRILIAACGEKPN